MANRIDRFSPKIEIINHFDSLINRVDIDIEKSLEKYNEEQVLSQLNCFQIVKRYANSEKIVPLKCYDSTNSAYIEFQTVDEWPESTKVVDYLNQIRKRTIDELTKAQEDTLKYYKLNSSHFKSNDNQLIEEKKLDEIRSDMFKEKFYFQVFYKPENRDKWVFNLYTFITDFYISPNDITLLELFINISEEDEEEFPDLIFDEHFFDNLKTQKFPSHVIIVRKEDLMNIQDIHCDNLNGVNLNETTIDLSNLEKLHLNLENPSEIKIEGLSSLKSLNMKFKSLDQVILSDLFGLKNLSLFLDTPINSEVLSKFIDYSPNIEMLHLLKEFSYFNLDSLSNLKTLILFGKMLDDFNFGLFDNLCKQLETIYPYGTKIDEKRFSKLFHGRNFPYLNDLSITDSTIVKFEREMLDGFRMLENFSFSNKLRIIDPDAFSNFIKLDELDLSTNRIKSIDKRLFSNLIHLRILSLCENRIEAIEENSFSSLHKLEILDLSKNKLASLDSKLFVGLRSLKMLDLSRNKLSHFDLGILDNIRQIEEIGLSRNPINNKKEILKRYKSSRITFIF